VRRGEFLKAHECVNRMREVNLRFASRIEHRSHQTNLDTRDAALRSSSWNWPLFRACLVRGGEQLVLLLGSQSQ
jgi:hypothetical protein